MDAALHVMRRNGFQGASVQDILDRAGLSTRAFYRQFRSKDDLLLAMFRTASDPDVDQIARSVAEAPTALGAVLVWVDQMLSLAFDRRRVRRLVIFNTVARQADGYEDEECSLRARLDRAPSVCPATGSGRRLVPGLRPGARCRRPVRPGLECGSSATSGRVGGPVGGHGHGAALLPSGSRGRRRRGLSGEAVRPLGPPPTVWLQRATVGIPGVKTALSLLRRLVYREAPRRGSAVVPSPSIRRARANRRCDAHSAGGVPACLDSVAGRQHHPRCGRGRTRRLRGRGHPGGAPPVEPRSWPMPAGPRWPGPPSTAVGMLRWPSSWPITR